MNRIYKSVFNVHTGTWVAVQETAKSQGKKSVKSSIVSAVTDLKTSLAALALASTGALLFLPSSAAHAVEIGSLFVDNSEARLRVRAIQAMLPLVGVQRQLPTAM